MSPFDTYEIRLIFKVDKEASFREAGNEGNPDLVLDVVKTALYDIDDTKVSEIEVEYIPE